MERFIRKDRLRSAITSLSEWRTLAQSQASAHLFPFLSLIKNGVNADSYTVYEEHDDFDFFDLYFRVEDDNDGPPYYDPLGKKRRIATHPHSNVATARKSTFERSWQAAMSKVEDGKTYWKLADDCADILVVKVMTRGGEVTRASVVDIASWLFRTSAFVEPLDARTLEGLFRRTFPMSDADYDKLFIFTDEDADNIFCDEPLSDDDVLEVIESIGGKKALSPASTAAEVKSQLDEGDPILSEVLAVLGMGTSGMILRGCPGTGKTWYAWNIALSLTNNTLERIKRIQFHASYGYEDFVEGYRPAEGKQSGFEIVPRVFMETVNTARGTSELVVLLIDEINRGDTSRVFGEILTYMEDGWRDVAFQLPFSGETTSIPRNLVIIATMNQHDRSITPLDMAMLRRFDHIDIIPSTERVQEFLSTAGMSPPHLNHVVAWFGALQKLIPPGIGHTYFLNVADLETLSIVWRYRILPYCESVLEFEPQRLEDVSRSFQSLRRKLLGQSDAGDG